MPQTQLLTRKAQIHLVEESTVDTYSAPGGSGTGMFQARNITYGTESESLRPEYHRNDMLNMDPVPGTATGTIGFEVPVKGSGTAGTAPEYGEALKACGMDETIVASTSVTYSPLSTFDGAGGNPGQSYSVSIIWNGVRFAIKGAFGSWVFTGNVGDFAVLAFTFTGAYVAVADDGFESPTYDTTTAPTFTGATLATNFGGAYTPVAVNAVTLDLGNQIVARRDVNDSSGIMGSRIVSRRSTGSMDPEAVTVATEDFWGDWRAGTSGTVDTGTWGSTAGNICQLTVNRAVKLAPDGPTDRDGIMTLTDNFEVTSAATDVEGTNTDIDLIFT